MFAKIALFALGYASATTSEGTYTLDGMDVSWVSGSSAYSKVVIMLHGGGMTGDSWVSWYN